MKRTYQPKKRRRLSVLGFLARSSSKSGSKVLKRRRTKGRKSLTVSEEFKLLRKKPKAGLR
jgi:large subunit ribosomal protein L34